MRNTFVPLCLLVFLALPAAAGSKIQVTVTEGVDLTDNACLNA